MCIKVGKCCCCVGLRTGAIVIAVLGIVGSLGLLAFETDWITIAGVIFDLLVYFCLLFGAIKVNKIAVLIYLILDVIEIILTFAEGIVFVVGGSLLNVVSQDDGSTVDTFDKAQQVQNFQYENDKKYYKNIIVGVCIILGACLEIYFFICIQSFYRKIKDGKITSAA